MVSMVLGDSTLESLTPSVNAPLDKELFTMVMMVPNCDIGRYKWKHFFHMFTILDGYHFEREERASRISAKY
jgi:hypothetical protein